MGNAGWMATTRDLAEDARRVAVQTQELYLSLGESQEHQSQPRTSIPESAGRDRPHPAPKSETVTQRLRTKDLKHVLVLQCSPNHCLSGHAGGRQENHGMQEAFQTCLAASGPLPRACRSRRRWVGLERALSGSRPKFFPISPEMRFVPQTANGYLCTLSTRRWQEIVPLGLAQR